VRGGRICQAFFRTAHCAALSLLRASPEVTFALRYPCSAQAQGEVLHLGGAPFLRRAPVDQTRACTFVWAVNANVLGCDTAGGPCRPVLDPLSLRDGSLPSHLLQQDFRPIHLVEGLAHDGGVQGYGAVLGGIEPVIPGNRMNVAVEHQSHQMTFCVDEGAA
jgi:hypothetical protein